MRARRYSILVLTCAALTGCVVAQELEPARGRIAASDPRFVYEGRFDFSDPDVPGIVWQDSRIAVDFEGPELGLLFGVVREPVFFDAEIDGATTLVELRPAMVSHCRVFSGLGAGRHHFVLTKRSEASAGTARFAGIELAPGAQAWAPERPAYKLRMQFFGDSITAAACNEDGDVDQWDDRRTHNSTRGYAAMTAAAFAADHRNIAVSGTGIATGWTEVKAGEIWDRVYPDPGAPRADLQSWLPDVVFVNLGENDDSFTTAKQLPFPSESYTVGYIALVRAMRAAWPKATIVILRGGMFGGSQSERLRGPWEAAVSQLEADDKAVSHFVFQHWSRNHPRVADHRAMAHELIAWLREQPFMAATR
jgi:lysophospholipase L1-like esterase